MDHYNQQIAKIGALLNATASEISNDTNLKKGEKFLFLQRIFVELKPLQKNFEKIEKEFKEFAFENLQDKGDNESEPVEFEGAEVLVKYIYKKPTLDSEKLKTELERAYTEIGVEFKESDFEKPTTPSQKVIIQSILKN
jgi:hypothetical protein